MDLQDQVAAAELVPAQEFSTGYTWSEIPRWHDGSFYFSDMYHHRILRLDADGRAEVVVDLSDRQGLAPAPGSTDPSPSEVIPGGIGWLPDGRMIFVSMHERLVLAWDGTQLQVHADLRPHATSSCNDMVVDEQGRAYVSQLGYDLFAGEEPRTASLLVVEPDGTVRAADEVGEFAGANGVAITADGRRLVTAEVDARQLTVMSRAEDGTLGERRVFAQTPSLPDGICLDERDGVWAGMPGSGYVGRFEEGGTMTHAVAIPMDRGMGVACVLGGDDRRTLHIAVGVEVFDWAKSRELSQGSIWTAAAPYSAGASRP